MGTRYSQEDWGGIKKRPRMAPSCISMSGDIGQDGEIDVGSVCSTRVKECRQDKNFFSSTAAVDRAFNKRFVIVFSISIAELSETSGIFPPAMIS